MQTVSSIMTPDPVSVTVDTSLDAALEIMDEGGIRHLPVLEGGALVGVVSDRDLLAATGWLPSRVHANRGPGVAERLPKKVREIMRGPAEHVAPGQTLAEATSLLLRHGVGCLPVVDAGRVGGMLTEMDLLAAYSGGWLDDRAGDGKVPCVADRMTEEPTTVLGKATLGDALELCRTSGIQHLPVVESGQLLGIVSDRDLRRAIGVGRKHDLPLDEIVTRETQAVAPGASLSQAARVMVQRKISSLPVLERDELVGILTLRDVLAHCLDACGGPGA
jgi:acetoin utilization protein AcuB